MFFQEILKKFQNTFFIVYLWIATSELIQHLQTMTIKYDLRKYLKILTIIIDFIENIWKFGAAMKLFGNRICSKKLFRKLFPWKMFI